MKIMIIDDETLALEDSAEVIAKVLPAAEIRCFGSCYAAIDAMDEDFDLAFLDIDMPGMNGLALAKELQKKKEKLNIIFVTAYSQYALEAYRLMASAYCLKPLQEEEVKKALDNLRYPVVEKGKAVGLNADNPDLRGSQPLQVTCFGTFQVYDYQGHPIAFRREKTKELVAFLVMKKGAPSTTSEIIEALWGEVTENTKSYFWKITSELRKTLRDLGKEDLFIQGKNQYALNTDGYISDYTGIWELDYKYAQRGIFEPYGGWPESLRAHIDSKMN